MKTEKEIKEKIMAIDFLPKEIQILGKWIPISEEAKEYWKKALEWVLD